MAEAVGNLLTLHDDGQRAKGDVRVAGAAGEPLNGGVDHTGSVTLPRATSRPFSEVAAVDLRQPVPGMAVRQRRRPESWSRNERGVWPSLR